MHRKLLSAALAATMTLTLAACGSAQDDAQSAENPDAYIVGICEQMEHVSLSEATRGFKGRADRGARRRQRDLP